MTSASTSSTARGSARSAEAELEAELPAPAGTPLYVHLPFCAAKCHYCDFFSLPDAGQDVDGMVDAILEEARQRAPRAPRTVFLGGGTPSLLSIAQLERLLNGFQALTGFRDSAVEVSAECNPESLDRDKAAAMLALGVTRLSIGFQSLNDEVLASFGRVHTSADSFRAFEAARAAGVRELSIDLIFAAPGHEPIQWERDLERVLSLEPEHLSAYNLTFEEDTVFQRWLEQGRIAKQPEETELELFHLTRALTAAHGFEAYEISNFARAGKRCRHNLNYWQNGPYVGLGPSAASLVHGRRSGNLRAIGPYRKAVARGERALSWSERLEPRARLGETWWLGLRLAEGVDPREARELAGWTEALDPTAAIVRPLLEEGLLVRREERFALSPAGLPLADGVAAEFLTGADES